MDRVNPRSSGKSFRENDYVEIWIEEGIIMEVFKPAFTEITLEMAKKIVGLRLEVSNEVTLPLFVDTQNIKYMNGQTRDYFATTESIKYLSAAAFLLHNYVAWLASSLFIKFQQPTVKTEFFRTKDKAIEWLKPYRDSVQ
ncbi:MAG TPA: hypothetical protein VF691_13720 [Cytophagaceae bacterium]|jgi:hypothetical protein